MSDSLEFLVRHGSAVLFAAVLIEQLGIPLPAAPWLLAAGALAGTGKLNWLVALCSAVIGSVLADLMWFYLGRYQGQRVLNLLCRISLEPDSCVRRTENLFTRYGMRGVVAAKFLPGLSTLAPPLAGSAGVGAVRFLFFDALGSLLYVGSFVLAGFLFSHQLETIIYALSGLGRSAVAVIVGLAALYISYKYFQRRRLLSALRMARITVSDLRRKQQDGEILLILDLRSATGLEQDPSTIPGAVQISLDTIKQGNHAFPRDREIIVFCSCPNEVTAARVALLLQRNGFSRVRPLLGGMDAWREQNYPLQSLRPAPTGVLNIQESNS